jgi:predicted dehydrogenase
MTQPPLKVGVIGFGKLGMLHAAVANGLASSELVSAADPSDDVLKSFQENKPELRIYSDHLKMLDNEKLDAVFIASPTFLHIPMSLDCHSRKIPFLVEKPLSISAASSQQLVDALRRQPLTHAVGYMGRFIETFARAKKVLNDGALGKPIHVRSTMYVTQLFKKGKGWRYEKEKSGGGVLITQNSHLIDKLNWFFGPFAAVNGNVKTWYSGSVDDFAHAHFEFSSGLTGYLDTSWSARHHRMVDISIDIQCENGTLTVTDDVVKLFLDDKMGAYAPGWTIWRKPDLYEPVEIDVGGPQYTRQDAAFLAAVRTRGSVDFDAFSAHHVQQVIDAIYESSQSGGRRVVIGGGK